jgi:hypothetical protein
LRRSNYLVWFAFGLILFVAACSPPGGNLQVATGPRGSATPTRVTEVALTATSTTAVPVESPLSTEVPAASPTVHLVVTPSEIETAPTQNASPELESSPLETPTVVPEPEDVTPNEAETKPGPTEEQLRLLTSLDNYGPAPQLHNEVWLNSEPLSLADLRGKVIMVEFWTFG